LKLYPIKTKTIGINDSLVEIILESLKRQKLSLNNNDVLALTSKIVSYSEGRVVELSKVKPSLKARRLAQRFSITPEFAELIIHE
jgi:coenzyme F420-0:L-glutamate ligase/coenzyme F420-1:gamma-L-glutamate ligase